MKPEITLVYDADCPNVDLARSALSDALKRTGLEPGWIECEQTSGVPQRFSRCGSPTILVNGGDVADEPDAGAACCRVYQTADGLHGVPPVETIVAAIERTSVPTKTRGGALVTKTTASGALGLAFVSALSWLCCLPIAAGASGVALAGIAATVGPWWPALAAGSLILLGVTVAQGVRGRGGLRSDHCDSRNHSRRQWLFVSVVGLLTLVLLTLPWWSAEITYRLIR